LKLPSETGQNPYWVVQFDSFSYLSDVNKENRLLSSIYVI